PAACAARKTLRPIRPKPLIPTFTAMPQTLLSRFGECLDVMDRWRSAPPLVGPDRDLDLVPVRVLEEGRVGAGTVGAPLAGPEPLGPTGTHPAFPGCLASHDPQPGEAEQAEPGLGLVVGSDEEDWFGDAPADRFVLLEVAPPAKGREQRVVERRAP